jgi:hypothetical protein
MPNEETQSAPIRQKSALAKPSAPAPAPKLPKLAEIVNDIIELDPDYYFSKRYEDVVEAASELPLVIEYINESLQRAAIAAADAKQKLSELEAEIFLDIRQRWNELYAEKLTEKSLDMAVLKNKDLSEASRNYSVLKSYVTRLSNMQENLRSKLDMLRTVEATKRKLIEDSPNDR